MSTQIKSQSKYKILLISWGKISGSNKRKYVAIEICLNVGKSLKVFELMQIKEIFIFCSLTAFWINCWSSSDRLSEIIKKLINSFALERIIYFIETHNWEIYFLSMQNAIFIVFIITCYFFISDFNLE